MDRLSGKVAVVTGVGPGIGAAIARAYSREGASLVLIARSGSGALDSVASEIANQGNKAIAVQGDVAKRDTWAEAKNAVDSLGGVDIVVNSAAVRARGKPLLDVSEREWDETLNVNLKSVYFSCHTFLPEMIEKGAGIFVNVSSVNGLVANPGMIDYATSKSGLHGFTRTLALDYGLHGIRANVIAPGAIFSEHQTSTMPEDELQSIRDNYLVGRWGCPEDVASAAVFFASDESSFITGTVLPVDGGLTIQTPEGAVRKSFRARWRDDELRFVGK